MIRSLPFFIFCILFSGMSLVAQEGIVPRPNSFKAIEGSTGFSEVYIVDEGGAENLESFLVQELERYGLAEIREGRGTAIFLSISNNVEKGGSEEAYSLSILSEGIRIEAGHEKGLFYGIQTLLQMMRKNLGSQRLSYCNIEDSPRFAWRGLMLDESRHFIGMEKLKQIIDQMAMHKLNVLHWHLTDAPAWRIEIKKYPKLTEIGAMGSHSRVNTEAQFYSQEEAKEIIAYAAERQIEVIPEIDMPGHASAAVLAYPEHSGGGTARHPNFTFNPGKEETYVFLEDILAEVASLFPSKYLHIGGDEVSFGNAKWKDLPEVKTLMEREKLKDLVEVEHYFIRRIQKKVHSLGKVMLGWDELATSGVPKSQVELMWWRHDKPEVLNTILEQGYQVILCPRIPLYFDFKQEEWHENGRVWGGKFASIDALYAFPESQKIPGKYNAQVRGIQANLWTERFESSESLDFMLYPRMAALAESAWTAPSHKSWPIFEGRLKAQLELYRLDKLYYYDPFQPKFHSEPEGARGENWQNRHKP